MKTSPGSPAPKSSMVSGDPGGQVLEMADGVSNEKMVPAVG
ncbi:hypothetical protein N8610_02350 [Akkermansiaceae bacterium]|nr:hypothetical protein [Akkermansiaceae bacterium]MDA7540722.1 hypothetical protein [bacterium]MDA7613260.1 hypothetical protein [Akkermansiaceae bacterium]MDA7617508.1 hypothetical protein [Akkermansiaceae bacterium]MDA7621460.1 hypothetical protein [Akkermansiaceae bacterium]